MADAEPTGAAAQPAGPRTRSASNDRALEILRAFENDGSGRQLEASELVKDAEAHLLNLEHLKAQESLERALKLDPMHEEAQRLLSRVQTELGDRRGEVAQVQQEVADEQNALMGQARSEVTILLSEAARLDDRGEHEQAIEKYERAIEMIHGFPFNLELGERMRYAKESLAKSRSALEQQKVQERRAFEAKIEEMRKAEKSQALDWERNRLNELRAKARESFQRGEYDVTISNADRILESFPEDLEARRLRSLSYEHKEIKRRQDIFVNTVEQHRQATLELIESAIIYQEIFRYPDADEWQRISPKVPTALEKFTEAETAVEKEIKRKLAESTDIGFPDPVPFAEAIALLRRLSGVNIILNKAAREEVDGSDLQVTMARVRDLPLENVLRLILRQSTSTPLDYVIKEGAVIIGTADTLESRMFLNFYDIHDIIQPHPDFPAPKLALDETEGQDTGGAGFFDAGLGEEEDRGAGTLEIDKLQELIEEELKGPDDEVVGSVQIQRGKLAVRTTFENHNKVAQLLDQFRQATGIMVTVESRFLVLQDNFLEEIGVDIGSGNNTFLLNSIPDIDGAGTSLAPGYEYLNAQGDVNVRAASIGQFSNPLGSQVNPFNVSSEGGGVYQLNVLTESYQLEALLTGVAKTQEIRRLSSPRVTAFNTQIAHTLVIDQAAYIKDLEVNQTGVIPVINPVIGVLNTGSILEVRPNVSHDRRYIVLEIQPTLAENLDSEQALLNLSGNFTSVPVELPVTSVTKIKTTVTIPDGGTVLLGGLKREIESEQSIGIPGLRRVPLLNLLFGRRGTSMLRSNLFVLINAKITVVQEEEERLFNI